VKRLRSVAPDRKTIGADALAAVPGAISSVPDGMASGVLAGVSPIHGLYATMAGAVGGGLTVSTKLMVVSTTSAAALAAGSAVAGVPGDRRPEALALLTLCTAAVMILAGIARLGRYTRFVSHSVMTGFLTGIAVNIVLGQLSDLTGAHTSGPFALAKAFDLITHPDRIELASLAVGVAALLLLIVVSRTRIRSISSLLALALPTAVLLIVGDTSVARVSDSGKIPSGFPAVALPSFSLFSFSLLTGALSVAAIVLVQGAGVRESAPSPDGRPSSVSGDFIGQGVGNALASLVKGQPVGASVGGTAFSVASGARSRWATILSGVGILVILLLVSGAVGKVAMPTLAAILIYAAVGSVQPAQVRTIFNTGLASQIALVATFVATLTLSIAAAVGIGVVLSLLLQLNREAVDLRVTELEPVDDGRLREGPSPRRLRSDAVTVLDVHGSLLFAGARTLQARLPDPAASHRPAVVLRLRGRVALGATFVVVATQYSDALQAVGGHLFLSGVEPELIEGLARTHASRPGGGEITVLAAREFVGESTREAYQDALEWLEAKRAADDEHRAAADENGTADDER
jgi:sulfate permease, SulP family